MQRRDFIKLSATGVAGSTLIQGLSNNLMTSEQSIVNKPNDAKFIWYNTEGTGRNLYACFRKTINIGSKVSEAELNIFADTSYQLFINGKFIEFGPVRFDPRFPLFDTHNIAPFLIKGKNVIAVQVKYFGMKTYKSIKNMAGMVSWGEIKDGKNIINLNSNKTNWRCIDNKAYSHYAQKISFALDTKDIYDQSPEEKEWKTPNFDDSAWKNAIELTNQDKWGKLEERNIPFMSGKNIEISELKQILPLRQTEDWYSFTIPTPYYFEEEEKSKYGNFLVFKTWIYSPINQDITAGVFWAETWLNGEELPKAKYDKFLSIRLNQEWKLKKGWNSYFAKVGTYFDAHHQYIALPKNKGLVVGADMKIDSEYSFFYLPDQKIEVFNQFLKNKPLPFSENDELKEVGGWTKVSKTERAFSPEREISWDYYGPMIENLKLSQLIGHTFKQKEYPEGFSILLALKHTQLVFPRIELSGVKDSIIDIGYSEHLSDDNQHLEQSFNYSGADRIYCNENKIDWIPSQPRGMWYVKITVRDIKQDISINNISFRSAMYPNEKKGSFKCSEPLLNEIWEMGATTQGLNMEDAYDDCVTRERGMYLRDTIIQYHNNLAVFGDKALMHRCLQLYGQSPALDGKFRAVYPNSGNYTIADFALNMPEGYLSYYENTGDKKTISNDWSALLKNLEWFNKLADQREDLLLDAEWDKKTGIHANYGGFHGDLQTVKEYYDNTGIHCTFSLTYLICLQAMEKLAKALNSSEELKDIQRRIGILTKSTQKFWDEEKEAFAENLDKKVFSIHANMFAVRSGIATENQIISIRKYIRSTFPEIFVNGYDENNGAYFSPNFAFYIIDGLYKAGLEDMAEKYIKEGWGWALAKGLKTTPEYFSLNSSLSHAWSACPTYYMSKNILGVNYPEAPNFNKVEVNIRTKIVNWAEGTFPHPNGGVIKVKWHRDDNNMIVADVLEAPNSVEVLLKTNT